MATHIPVLQKEVLEYLSPKPNENFIDCTIGEGGHTLAILEKTRPGGKVLGIDSDSEILKCLRPDLKHLLEEKRLVLVCDSFVNLKKIVEREKFQPVSGILFDLGMSSWHLEDSYRGFSFQKDEPLDMRYNIVHFPRPWKPHDFLTAGKIVNQWSEKEIEMILREYGEERFAKRISKKIVEESRNKPIQTTFQLVEIIKKAIPRQASHQKIHFATRTFQALRIAVNDELNNLKKTLPQAIEILETGGRLVIISFHSLEDRIVKNFYRGQTSIELKNIRSSPPFATLGYSMKPSPHLHPSLTLGWSMKFAPSGLPSSPPLATLGYLKILTKKPIRPSTKEIKINPRSRSAKLRAAIKIT